MYIIIIFVRSILNHTYCYQCLALYYTHFSLPILYLIMNINLWLDGWVQIIQSYKQIKKSYSTTKHTHKGTGTEAGGFVNV